MTNRLSKPDISVIIPCLNEADCIRQTVRTALLGIKWSGQTGEVLVIDNGSTDKSRQYAEKAGATVTTCPIKGYGAALIFGFQRARGRYLVMGDADGSYDFSAIPSFIQAIKAGNDLVIGSRFKGRIEPDAMPWLHRYIGTPILTTTLNIFFGSHFSDCNSGMRALTKSAFQKLRLESTGMEFASEMLVKAAILQLRSADIPIVYHRDKRKQHRPHLHTWQDGWKHLRFLILYAPHKLFVTPGIVAFITGSALVFSQIKGKIVIGHYLIDFHFMILGVFIGLLGITLMQLGIGLEMLSSKRGYQVGNAWLYFRRIFQFEVMLVIGGLLFLCGFGIDLFILISWIKDGFTNIIYFRPALAASYTMSIGVQLAVYAVFYTILSEISLPDNIRKDVHRASPPHEI